MRRYREPFSEPPGSEHLVSENAGSTESVNLLAVHIADDGAVLATINEWAANQAPGADARRDGLNLSLASVGWNRQNRF
jgi:hypothetical protein